jgi:hypothetical protein
MAAVAAAEAPRRRKRASANNALPRNAPGKPGAATFPPGGRGSLEGSLSEPGPTHETAPRGGQ